MSLRKLVLKDGPGGLLDSLELKVLALRRDDQRVIARGQHEARSRARRRQPVDREADVLRGGLDDQKACFNRRGQHLHPRQHHLCMVPHRVDGLQEHPLCRSVDYRDFLIETHGILLWLLWFPCFSGDVAYDKHISTSSSSHSATAIGISTGHWNTGGRDRHRRRRGSSAGTTVRDARKVCIPNRDAMSSTGPPLGPVTVSSASRVWSPAADACRARIMLRTASACVEPEPSV